MADARRAVASLMLALVASAATAAIPATVALHGAKAVEAAAPPLSVGLLVPRHGALWGAWAYSGGASSVASFEATIKRRLDIVHQYHAWNETWPSSTEYSWAAGGRIIFGNISARTKSSGVYTWSSIAAGSHDADIHAMASRIRAFGRSLFVSFDQEPESRLGGAGFSGADYINASRRLHNIFAADGVHNVVWVWNVAGSTSSSDLADYKSLYPGDAYVDWVAWDPYNWNVCIHPYGWRSFDQTVAGFYNWLAGGHLSAGSAGKPYMLAEYGSVEGASGAKGTWFRGEGSTLPSRPRIKAVVYFNENKDCNWPITTSSSSMAGFVAAGQTCWVNRALPSAPTAVTAAAGSGSATVRWAASRSVCPISIYTINASPGGKQITVSGKALAATVTGLSIGTGYTFAVRATSVNGASGWSARSAAVAPFGGTQNPSSPTATPTSKPTATPPAKPSGTPPAGSTPTGAEPSAVALVTGTDALTRWLESNLVAIPIVLAGLLFAGFALQVIASRRRRGH